MSASIHRPADDRSPSPVTPAAAATPHDILREAWRAGAARPLAVHVRPEVHARLRQRADAAPGEPDGGPLARLPVIVDEDIPIAPGFEIHRAPPAAKRRTAPSAGRGVGAAGS